MSWDSQKAAQIIAANRHLDGPALPVLRALQDAFGYLPEQAVGEVAEALNLCTECHAIGRLKLHTRHASANA